MPIQWWTASVKHPGQTGEMQIKCHLEMNGNSCHAKIWVTERVVNVKELSLVSPSKHLLWLFVQPCYLSEMCQDLVWNVLTDVIDPLNVALWKIIPSLKAVETKPKRCAVKDAFSDTNLSIEEDVLAPSSLFKEQWSCRSYCHVVKFCLSCQSP